MGDLIKISERPETRGGCVDVPRPCPFISCRHHLRHDRVMAAPNLLSAQVGVVTAPGPSCSLDEADLVAESERRWEDVGDAMGVSRETVRIAAMSAFDAIGASREMLGEVEVDERAIAEMGPYTGATALARRTGVARTTVQRRINRARNTWKRDARGKGYSPDEKARAVEAVAAGKSQCQVARDTGISQKAISNWCIEAGIGSPGTGSGGNRKRPPMEHVRAVVAYAQKFSRRAAAKRYGISRYTVGRWVRLVESGVADDA